MNNKHLIVRTAFLRGRCLLLVVALAWLISPQIRANVYVTNLRINNSFTNVAVSAGAPISISYILNEPATAGLTIEVRSSTNLVRTINLTNGTGTVRGTNTVAWDGKDNGANNVAAGTYSFRVTAKAVGFDDWTETSDDGNQGNYVHTCRGLAVNKNPSSPFYGRVFVGNANLGPNPAVNAGDRVGLLLLNADGSPAEGGGFSDGGYDWAHGNPSSQTSSPWKIEVADDDRVYIGDFLDNGVVLSFDQAISSNSLQNVLREDNWPNDGAVNLSGPFITHGPTNLQVWMADSRNDGVGIRRWDIGADGVIASNDLGMTIVAAGLNSDLNQAPFDVALDRSNRIYTIQQRFVQGDGNYRVFRFPAYNESGNPETVADWKIGRLDDTMAGAFGVAVDPTGSYVAVAFQGVFVVNAFRNGSVRVFNATNGQPVAMPTPIEDPSHDYRDAAWDNVGNLYVADDWDDLWKVYSPPGTNQATTVALASATISGSTVSAPLLTEPSYTNGQFSCFLIGQPDVLYYLQTSTDLKNWTTVVTNTSPLTKKPITVNTTNRVSFYRALVGAAPSTQPKLSAPSYSAGQFHFTLNGVANASYIIQASTNLQLWVPVITNTSANATRSIDVPAPNSRSLYRALLAQ